MIPAAPAMTQVDELTGEEIEFGISDPKWMMRVTADLYSNRELACVREYSTNARDANIEAGNADKPIKVTLPSVMNPYFVVRDFGLGMSAEILTEIYTQFGESTKRKSNKYNGMLGLGCKSAVAYTDTFTVTSIHNGIKTVAIIMRKPDYTIVMKILASSRTTDPSGTEISIPVHNWQEFAHKAKDFYKFWLPGTVTVNGVEPVHHVGEKIIDGLYYSKDWNTSYVVMGNVPYRIANPDALFRDTKMNRINFVAYVDNGDVEFTPSREDLKYTEVTNKTLERVVADFESKILNKASTEISKAKTHYEAFEMWCKWTDLLGRPMFSDLEFKGDKFKSDFKVNAMRYDARGYRYGTQRVREWHIESMKNTLVVTDFDITLTSKHKTQAKAYRDLKDIKASYILFTAASANEIDSVWLEKNERFVSWGDLKSALPKKAPKPRQAYTGGRVSGSFDYYTRKGMEWEQDVPEDVDLYYILVQDAKTYPNVSTILSLLDSDAVVIKMPANRIEKFKRDYPSVKPFIQWAKSKVVTEGHTLLTDDAKTALSISSEVRRLVGRMDFSKIEDPEFQRIANLIKNDSGLTKAYDNNINLAHNLGMWYTVKKYQASPTDDSLFTKYPLLSSLSHYAGIHPDVYVYINAKHRAVAESE